MKFKSTLYSQDFVRTTSAKVVKEGGQGANWLRQERARRSVSPVTHYTAEQIVAINQQLKGNV